MLSIAIWTALSAYLAVGVAAAPPSDSLDPNDYHASNVIYRDVAIIGGGSSGTYTAVRLKDHGKSVVVVEKKGTLGGHSETYTAPNGYAINYGVRVFNQVQVVKDYFARFKIPLVVDKPGGPIDFVDFSTGKSVKFALPDDKNLGAAFQAYMAQLMKYPELRIGFNLTYPIHEDLLLSYADFTRKYNVGPMVYTTFMHQGLVPLLDTPMLYVFKYINAYLVQALATGYLVPKDHDIQALYRAAHAFLGDDSVLTGSVPVRMDRNSAGKVKILVETPSGRKLIVAKKLVSAIPPTLDSLRGYDLSATERDLFAKWTSSGYYAGILKDTGLDGRLNYFFSQPDKPFGVPKLPGVYMYGGTGADGFTEVLYGAPTVMSDGDVKADIEMTLKRVQAAHGLPQKSPSWAVFASHSPFNIQVSRQDIKNGFYKKLFALNGQSNTFYNGAAFQGWSSTELWEFSEEYLLPLILKALK